MFAGSYILLAKFSRSDGFIPEDVSPGLGSIYEAKLTFMITYIKGYLASWITVTSTAYKLNITANELQ